MQLRLGLPRFPASRLQSQIAAYVAAFAKAATRVDSGMRPTMARLTLACKIAAITLTMWKKGVSFDPKQLQRQAA